METTTERKSRGTTGERRFYLDIQKAIAIAQGLLLPSPEDVLLEYIERYWSPGTGTITPINVPKSACNAATILLQASEGNYKDQNVTCKSDSASIIATGVLQSDVKWADNDPYQTAGGYIGGIAKAGTKFKMHISYSYVGFEISVHADVNILKDHYNNNFYGVSTGNGTTEYKEGERVENKVIGRGTTLGDFWGGKCPVVIRKIDLDKIRAFVLSVK